MLKPRPATQMRASTPLICCIAVISGWIARVLLVRMSTPSPRRPHIPVAVAAPVTPLPLLAEAVAMS
jgi:hypothetical protein